MTFASQKAPMWYQETSETEAAKLLVALVESLRTHELQDYRTNTRFYSSLYAGSQDITGTGSNLDNQPRYNLVKSGVDTCGAIFSAARTLPYYDTRGADWKLRRQASKCNQTLQTQFTDTGVFKEANRAIMDAVIGGIGAIKFFQDPSKTGATPSCARQLPLSIVWDPAEATQGDPSNLYQVVPVDREWLANLFPEHRTAIEKANGPGPNDKEDFALDENATTGRASESQCLLYEGWHLSGNSEKPGVRVLAVSGQVLERDDYKSDIFPFAILHGFLPNQVGFVGQSLVHHLQPAQTEINELLEYKAKLQKFTNVYCFVYDQGKVTPEQLDNEPFKIVRVAGGSPNKPEFVPVLPPTAEYSQEVQRIR
jgi:hypothetical protein